MPKLSSLLVAALLTSQSLAWAQSSELPPPTVGSLAPVFAVSDQDGKVVSSKAIAGKWTIFYFYPKDDTPGCTLEAQTYTTLAPEFKKLGVDVYGVSLQDAASKQAFREKYDLTVPLLVDDGKMALAFGVNVRLGNFAARDTFVIDPAGKIARIDRGVDPGKHPGELLAWLQAQIKK